jgi:hypothetical protein
MKKLTGIVIGLAFMLCAFSAQAASTVAVQGVGSMVQQLTCTTDDNCTTEAPICLEGFCVECITDDNCTSEAPLCIVNSCVECVSDTDCPGSNNPCDGDAICTEGVCGFTGNDCADGEICVPDNETYTCEQCVVDDDCPDEAPICSSEGVCVECEFDFECPPSDDPCDGSPICDNGTCALTGDPCIDEGLICISGMFPNVVAPAPFECVECVEDDDCEDDGLFCTGTPICDNNTCALTGDPCLPDDLLCNEEIDECVECETDFDCFGDNSTPFCDGLFCVQCLETEDCEEGLFCREGDCVEAMCELKIRPRKVRISKMFRPLERRFRIKAAKGSEEMFDPFAAIDFGLINVRKAAINRKGVLKVLATIPASKLGKGPVEVFVGDCRGEIVLK